VARSLTAFVAEAADWSGAELFRDSAHYFPCLQEKFPRLRQLATALPKAQALSVTAVVRARAALLGRRVPSRCADLVAVSVSVGFIATLPSAYSSSAGPTWAWLT